MAGLITGSDEAAYRGEVGQSARWYEDNNLSLNVQKMKEIALNFRSEADYPSLFIIGSAVKSVSSRKKTLVSTSLNISDGL